MAIMFFEKTTSNNPSVNKYVGQWAQVTDLGSVLKAKFEDGAVLTTGKIVRKLGGVDCNAIDITTNNSNYRFEKPSLWDFERKRPPVPKALTIYNV